MICQAGAPCADRGLERPARGAVLKAFRRGRDGRGEDHLVEPDAAEALIGLVACGEADADLNIGRRPWAGSGKE